MDMRGWLMLNVSARHSGSCDVVTKNLLWERLSPVLPLKIYSGNGNGERRERERPSLVTRKSTLGTSFPSPPGTSFQSRGALLVTSAGDDEHQQLAELDARAVYVTGDAAEPLLHAQREQKAQRCADRQR